MADFGVQPPRESAFEGELELLDALLVHVAARLPQAEEATRHDAVDTSPSVPARVMIRQARRRR